MPEVALERVVHVRDVQMCCREHICSRELLEKVF